MSSAKKIGPGFEDPVNAKIQRKFDLVFTEEPIQEESMFEENTSSVFNDGIDFDTGLGEDMAMDKKGDGTKDHASIDLDFSMDDDAPPPVAEKTIVAPKADEGMDFSLDFDFDADVTNTKTETTSASIPLEEASEGFTLDLTAEAEESFEEATKKTVVVDPEHLTNSNLDEFSIENTGSSSNSSADLMSTEEAKANIESTIKDILKPKFEGTKEIDVSTMVTESSITHSNIDEIEDSVLDLSGKTPSRGFTLGSLDDGSFSLDPSLKPSSKSTAMTSETTGDFDIASFNSDEVSIPEAKAPVAQMPEVTKSRPVESAAYASAAPAAFTTPGPVESMPAGEDPVRVHATIRTLREEREDLLAQIKNLKGDAKELEQDNLTLKANLDEAKIEITILRKRHMVELEDLKYRLTISEEKKAIADERARQSDARREKLEQKVRIDFNQVKQREKELESKLELLSMDVDSQVQSRDQKILELRRKIDALEFNMENASIKEQKSLDDKRKLEDRLNKIMKTLRHSIKNLEDDIDHVEEEDDRQKEKN